MRYPTMFALLLNLLATLRSAFRTRAELALENLALRQQLATLSRSAPWPRLRRLDRAFWIALSQIWHRSADALYLVFLVLRHDRRQAVHLDITESVRGAPWRLASSRMLDQVIVLGESHLHRILKSHFAYYRRARPHLSLGKDSPGPRAVQPPSTGDIVKISEVGGLHHRYEHRVA